MNGADGADAGAVSVVHILEWTQTLSLGVDFGMLEEDMEEGILKVIKNFFVRAKVMHFS